MDAPANGGGFAALLGLIGTGLVSQFKVEGGGSGVAQCFRRAERLWIGPRRRQAPIPTVLPSLAATITPAQAMFVNVRNGFLVKNGTGALIGGAQGFEVAWSGALLVDEEGTYEFSAEVPALPHDRHCCDPTMRSNGESFEAGIPNLGRGQPSLAR